MMLIHSSKPLSWLYSALLAATAASVHAQTGAYGAYGDGMGMDLGVTCGEGEQPALLHAFVGVYEEGGFNSSTTEALSDEFNDVLDHVGTITGLPVSAVSTVEDADPDSPTPFTANRFGGFLLFSDVLGFDMSPAEGADAYWLSEPHLAFGPSYMDVVLVNDAGRGAATVQLQLCIPYDLEGLGEWHVGIIVDVAEGGAGSEVCGGTLLDTLNGVAAAAADSAGVAAYCGSQWEDWETLVFAGDIAGFDFNKANSVSDVVCVFNFDTPIARDAFALAFEGLWEEAAGTPLADDVCVGEYWAWAME